MATVVVALGGSLLRPEVEERHNWIMDLVGVIVETVESGAKVALVVGGGAPAREGIELARPFIGDITHLDRIGIAATRLNATIVREALAEGGVVVSRKIPEKIEDAVLELEGNDVVVMGGTEPGHTTDAVAIRLAIQSGADKCVIATNVSKVFSQDPNDNPDAESFDELTLKELQEIVGPPEHSEAGTSQVVDPVGVSDAVEHGLSLDVLDGRSTLEIKKSLEGANFDGTMVRG
jgi:uridylate kinase